MNVWYGLGQALAATDQLLLVLGALAAVMAATGTLFTANGFVRLGVRAGCR